MTFTPHLSSAMFKEMLEPLPNSPSMTSLACHRVKLQLFEMFRFILTINLDMSGSVLETDCVLPQVGNLDLSTSETDFKHLSFS